MSCADATGDYPHTVAVSKSTNEYSTSEPEPVRSLNDFIHSRNMTSRSRGAMRPSADRVCPREGAGNAGCTPPHPRSRTQWREWVRARAYGLSGGIRHPLRNGFTAYAALSPATNSSCHRRRRMQRLVNPVGLNLSPPTWHQQRVSGPHGFAVRYNVVRPARLQDRSRGSTRPATAMARRRSRVHHIPSRVRDDARPPLLPERDGRS